MATQKQIDANRRNAQKSTGPVTPEGKAAVRLNALTHGLRARDTVLPSENQEDFNRLCAGLEAEFQPCTPVEQSFLEDMAIAYWKLARLARTEKFVHTHIFDDPHALIMSVNRISQFEMRLQNSYIKSLRELQRLQKARLDAPAPELQPVEELPAPPAPATAPRPPAAAAGPVLVPSPLPPRPPAPSQPPVPQSPYVISAAAAPGIEPPPLL